LKINERLVSYQQFIEGVKIIPKLGESALSMTPPQKEAADNIRKGKKGKKGKRRPARSPEQREGDVIKACKKGLTITEARLVYGATRLVKDANKFLRKAKKDGRLMTRTVTIKSAKTGRKVTGERWFSVG